MAATTTPFGPFPAAHPLTAAPCRTQPELPDALGLADDEPVVGAVWDGDEEDDAGDDDEDDDGDGDGDGEGEGEDDAEGDGEGEADLLGDGDGDADLLGDGDDDVDLLGDADGEGEADLLGDGADDVDTDVVGGPDDGADGVRNADEDAPCSTNGVTGSDRALGDEPECPAGEKPEDTEGDETEAIGA
jgi:hypothetical protein